MLVEVRGGGEVSILLSQQVGTSGQPRGTTMTKTLKALFAGHGLGDPCLDSVDRMLARYWDAWLRFRVASLASSISV